MAVKTSPPTPQDTQSVKKTAAATAPEDELPDASEVAAKTAMLAHYARDSRFSRLAGYMQSLAAAPPQVLLLEGGTPQERLLAADYWSCLLNCQESSKTEPCFACTACIRMLMHQHRDCFFFDGASASIKIADVRNMRTVLGEPPHEARYRMVLFCEAQSLIEAAANALLKSLEEPCASTSFVFLVPQRERLLPTLVSRSMVLTLPWPTFENPATSLGAHDLLAWESALCTFFSTGKGLFEITGSRGAVTAPLVEALCGMLRRALVQRMRGENEPPIVFSELTALFNRLPEPRLRMFDEALAECQESLQYGVNPTLIVEWLLTRMYLLFPSR